MIKFRLVHDLPSLDLLGTPGLWLGFVPASKMRLRRGLGYPTQITVPYVFTVCNPTLQKKFFTHAQKLPK